MGDAENQARLTGNLRGKARGMFAGLTLSHTRGHLYRAVLEGTAYGVRHNLEAISGMGCSCSAFHCSSSDHERVS